MSGLAAGVAVSAPPGPVGSVCVARTLRHGLAAGLWSGLGAALGDSLYAAVAAGGLAAAEELLPARRVVALVAAPLLLAGGVRLLARVRRDARSGAACEGDSAGAACPAPWKLVASAAVLTLGAPGTLPALVALLAALGPGSAHPAVACAGVFAGCFLWWLVLCGACRRFRGGAARCLPFLDAASGALLVLASLVALRAGLC